MTRTTTKLLFCLTALVGFPSSATVYVVEPDGSGDFSTIQEAIDSVANGDIIELSSGTFTGNGNRDVDFLGKAITVRSHSGNPQMCVIDCQGSPGDQHRGFSFQSGEGIGSVLQGITVTQGYAEAGSGALCLQSSPRFVDCIFSSNTSLTYGSGLCCVYSASPRLDGCLFLANTSPTDTGGGMYCAYTSSLQVTDCVFSENSADYKGGAVVLHDGSTGVFINCTFFGNAAQYGGGIYCSMQSSLRVVSCTFSGNAAEGGSGLYCYATSTVDVDQCIVAFSMEGNAIQLQDCDASLACCDVYGNAGGDWTGGIQDQYGIDGNISADPLFCDPGAGDFTLHVDSPCAPFSPPNEECDLIGAWPVACGDPTAPGLTTWGRIKAAYR